MGKVITGIIIVLVLILGGVLFFAENGAEPVNDEPPLPNDEMPNDEVVPPENDEMLPENDELMPPENDELNDELPENDELNDELPENDELMPPEGELEMEIE